MEAQSSKILDIKPSVLTCWLTQAPKKVYIMVFSPSRLGCNDSKRFRNASWVVVLEQRKIDYKILVHPQLNLLLQIMM